MAIENANSHPIKVVKVEEGGPYANSHPYKVEVVKGGSSTELVSELPEVGEEGTTYVLVDSTTNPSKVYGMYIYLNEWILTAQPVDQAVQKVEELPQEGQEGILYYLEKEGQDDTYDLYRWINSEWIKVDTDIKLYDSEGSNTDGAATQRLVTSLKGLARTLTTADYNWPTSNPDGVALWLLPVGLYYRTSSSVKVYFNNTGYYPNAVRYNFYIVYERTDSFAEVILLTNTLSSSDDSGRGRMMSLYVNNGQMRNDIAFVPGVFNGLTSTSTTFSLSAAQGKVLNDKIGGDLSGLNTTDKTSLINAINEVLANGGGVKILTSADYNWPTTGTKTSVAAWLLEDGVYITNDVPVKFYATEVANNTGFLFTVATNSSTGNKQVFLYGNNWLAVREIEPTLGSSLQFTDFATASLVYADPNTKQKIKIGNNASVAGSYGVAVGYGANAASSAGVAVGYNAKADLNGAVAIIGHASASNSLAFGYNAIASGAGSIAIGSNSSASSQGEINVGTSNTGQGYSDSNYRLLTGLYDPQSAHDAATKGYIDTLVGDIETALHTLNNGEES